MTYRIHRSTSGDRVVFALSGDINQDHGEGLQTILATEAPDRVLLDLKDVTLVDRNTVRWLARAEATGVALVNCPEYVRSWIAMEQAFTKT